MDNSNLSILDDVELLTLTRWQLDEGQFGNALISVKHALLRDDAPLESHRLAAKIYAQLGLFDHSKQAFEKFLEQEPGSLVEQFQYGMVHYDSGDNVKALDIWNGVLEKEATYPPALFYAALAQANSNQPEKAIELLDILIKSAPADNLYFERGRELIRAIEQNRASDIKTGDIKTDTKSASGTALGKYSTDDERTIN